MIATTNVIQLKALLSVLVPLSIFLSAGVTAQVRVSPIGDPTPALAMYAAQTRFAADTCVSGGSAIEEKEASIFLKDFNKAILLKWFDKSNPKFAADVRSFYTNYDSAWGASSQEIRQQFCSSFRMDISSRNEEGSRHWRSAVSYFRGKFSPLSDEAVDRLRKMDRIASTLSVVGTVASTVASVSAAGDSVSSARSGDWTTSNQQMAASRNFNQVAGAMANLAADQSPNAETVSVLELESEDGTLRVVRCPVVEHFLRYQDPIDSATWTTYQQISLSCRDPVPADLEH